MSMPTVAEVSKLAADAGMGVTDYCLALLVTEFLRDAADEKRTERKGEWDQEWWVKSHEKGRVRYKSEEAAYEGGRYWRQCSEKPDEVEVYVTEVKRFPAEIVPIEDWSNNGATS